MAYRKYSKPQIVKEPRVFRQWSDYQKNIFSDIQSGTGNTQVDALAGTGKTSTIVEAFYYIPQGVNSLMCAFNTSIKKELEARAADGVEVKTLHGHGYAACRAAFPRLGKIDDKGEKLNGYIRALRGDDPETSEIRDNLATAVSLCKGYLAHTHNDISDVMDRHDVDPCNENREDFIHDVIKIMNACKKDTQRIDFDDMIWFPNVHNLPLNRFGMVFIDEAQDLNLAQINIALNSVTQNGRIVSVGDRFQAIYQFRGADSNAIQNIVDRCNSKRLPLSVTYRCAKAIVALAKELVPELEASPNAEEGLVTQIPISKMTELVKPGDFILSRTNAPLIKWCMSLLKEGIPANIQGRDVGKSLMSLIKRSKASTVNNLLDWLQKYKEAEVERLISAKKNTSYVEDKVECLVSLCDGVFTLPEVKDNINKLFKDGDEKSRVILSSTHKAKGLERDRVFMLNDTYRPSKGVEEANLTYVAYTRAKKELYLVKGVNCDE